MVDRDLFQLEEIDIKRTSKDLALVWREFDRLVDIEEVAQNR